MKIPLSKYEFAHVRKAVTAGVLAVGAAVGTALTNGVSINALDSQKGLLGFAGVFVLSVLATFNVPNKKVLQAISVIDEIDPALTGVINEIIPPAAPEQPAPPAGPGATSPAPPVEVVVTPVPSVPAPAEPTE